MGKKIKVLTQEEMLVMEEIMLEIEQFTEGEL